MEFRYLFIDESGAKTNMTRLYARALGGQRAVDAAPHGHWSTTTMISALRVDGRTADMVIDSAVNRPRGGSMVKAMFDRFDKNKDGQLDADERPPLRNFIKNSGWLPGALNNSF